MEKIFIEEKTYDKGNFTVNPLRPGEYENCTFLNCDFSNTKLSEIKLISCSFFNCNLSLVQLNGTILRDVSFKDCKMLGLLFYTCNDFGLAVNFDTCNLNHSSFYNRKIRKTTFKNSKLEDVDLTSSSFDGCDLTNAKFENSIIEKVDFRGASHYSVDPAKNRIKKAKFSLSGLPGLLDVYDIEIEH
jgi:fluoroquinolone resistance protein